MNADSHEIVSSFAQSGLGLHKTLCEMLDEHPSHRTERRGCGYTQATRFLSTFVNQPRSATDAFDSGVFADWPKHQTESLARQAIAAGWPQGWRGLDRCDPAIVGQLLPAPLAQRLVDLPCDLDRIGAALQREESRLLFALLQQILAPEASPAPTIPEMREKPEIGSCSQAEEFFLEIAHDRVRRGGRVNLFVDGDGAPVLVEKMGLGESHSAMAVAPVAVCDVTLPPGALFALRYPEDAAPIGETGCGQVFPLAAISQARFLRLTTLSVSPKVRRRAFSSQFESQLHGNMLSPSTTTIEQLLEFARTRLAKA